MTTTVLIGTMHVSMCVLPNVLFVLISCGKAKRIWGLPHDRLNISFESGCWLWVDPVFTAILWSLNHDIWGKLPVSWNNIIIHFSWLSCRNSKTSKIASTPAESRQNFNNFTQSISTRKRCLPDATEATETTGKITHAKQLTGPVFKALQGRFWASLIGSTFYSISFFQPMILDFHFYSTGAVLWAGSGRLKQSASAVTSKSSLPSTTGGGPFVAPSLSLSVGEKAKIIE